MEPTAYAMQMAEPISYALSAIEETLNQRIRFDPASSERKFIVDMSDIGEIYFLPKLMEMLAKDMEAGRVDLAIGWLLHLKSGFFQRRLFVQDHVCIFRRGHKLDKKSPLTRREFEAAEHVLVSAVGTGHATLDKSIEKLGVIRHVALKVPHFVAVGHILSATDMVATVPERFARHCVDPFNLRYVTLPLKLPEIGVNLFWHSRFHKEPGNQWLRGQVSDRFNN